MPQESHTDGLERAVRGMLLVGQMAEAIAEGLMEAFGEATDKMNAGSYASGPLGEALRDCLVTADATATQTVAVPAPQQGT